ncbi:MAG: alpha/beta hydrolase [Anaerolineaceae bacterium]|nr:alpha/beta hydrolase [Anaerolineaceae bacterium]
MKKINPLGLFIILLLLLIVLGPLLIPLPPLDGIKPMEALVYSDSQFMEINGVDVHYQEIESNSETLIVLLHGFGSSTYSWQKVMQPFSSFGSVLAYDRPGFGLTERVIPYKEVNTNPYLLEYQSQILLAFSEAKTAEKIILVGNSAGGTVAMQTALAYPDRIDALILISPAVYGGGGAPKWIKPLLNLPQMDRLGPVLVRTIRERGLEILELAWSDPEKIREEDLINYQKPLSVDRWDVGLWEFTKANGENDIDSRISEITMPVLVITGADDKIIPADQSIQLASELPNASLVVIPDCGHVPQEECPTDFMNAVEIFINNLP